MTTYILTTNSYNYGSILQKYGLFSYIKNNICNDVFIVNTKILTDSDKIFSKTQEYSKLSTRIYIKICNYINNKRITKIKAFEMKHLKTIDYDKFIRIVKKGDMIVVGSDQVWNPDALYNVYTLDRPELRKIDKNVKKITYAVSMPKDKINVDQQNYFKKILPFFASISVRENKAKELLSELTTKKIEVSLDPTFLINNEEFNNFTKNIPQEDEYILMYMVRPMPIVKKISKIISKKTGLKVINLGNMNVISKGIKNSNNSGVEEFVSLFKNAKYIITNSFHGTVFSIIFKKSFISVSLPYTGGRAKDLLSKLGLDNRLVKDESDCDKLFSPIDYDTVYDLVEKQRKLSKDYLKREMK